MKKTVLACMAMIGCWVSANAQPSRWQQKVHYKIDATLNVHNNLLNGTEHITYWNNSPDTLKEMFIFLYWNAFQPGSMMDVRSQYAGKIALWKNKKGDTTYDWDSRVKDRISKLTPSEQGYQKISHININGVPQPVTVYGTVMKVLLKKPILPHSSVPMEVAFEAQVPVQIRRSGRDNKEGVRYSMSQWYPKIAEYDYQGWNPNPYIGREFYGVYGTFDVHLTLDKNYLVAGTGTVQNPEEVGFGYGSGKSKADKNGNLTWKFHAENVHDFVWAADDQYTMFKRQPKDGPLLYFVYKKKDKAEDLKWKLMADTIEIAYPFIAKTFGRYQYPNYTFIQGGDGGMEYPMATLIKSASIGTALHEWMHNWYQGVLGSNESLYPFLDEGGATYAETRISGWLHHDSLWYKPEYSGYYNLVYSRLEEPMTTHSDHYMTNFAYSSAAYSKGAVFYEQLSYIIGNQNMDRFLLEYEKEWRFKHPNPTDFIQVAEKVSGMELQWYKEYWIGTTKTIDYGFDTVYVKNNEVYIRLKKYGQMPMPIDFVITLQDGSQQLYYIPTNLTFGNKPAENNLQRTVLPVWYWVADTYEFKIPIAPSSIKEVEIDPSQRMADINRENNKITFQ